MDSEPVRLLGHAVPTAGSYALLHANGMSFADVLAKHEHDLIAHLANLGEDTVNDFLWGDDDEEDDTM